METLKNRQKEQMKEREDGVVVRESVFPVSGAKKKGRSKCLVLPGDQGLEREGLLSGWHGERGKKSRDRFISDVRW